MITSPQNVRVIFLQLANDWANKRPIRRFDVVSVQCALFVGMRTASLCLRNQVGWLGIKCEISPLLLSQQVFFHHLCCNHKHLIIRVQEVCIISRGWRETKTDTVHAVLTRNQWRKWEWNLDRLMNPRFKVPNLSVPLSVYSVSACFCLLKYCQERKKGLNFQ